MTLFVWLLSCCLMLFVGGLFGCWFNMFSFFDLDGDEIPTPRKFPKMFLYGLIANIGLFGGIFVIVLRYFEYIK